MHLLILSTSFQGGENGEGDDEEAEEEDDDQ